MEQLHFGTNLLGIEDSSIIFINVEQDKTHQIILRKADSLSIAL